MSNESNPSDSTAPETESVVIPIVNPMAEPVTTAGLLLAIKQMADLAITEIVDGRNLREGLRCYATDYPDRAAHLIAYLNKDTEKLAEIEHR